MSFLGSLRQHLDRARDAERFVRFIVAGGLALDAGLWIARLAVRWTAPWAAGVVLALVGVAAVASGILSELEY